MFDIVKLFIKICCMSEEVIVPSWTSNTEDRNMLPDKPFKYDILKT